jgi:hypothetical protein
VSTSIAAFLFILLRYGHALPVASFCPTANVDTPESALLQRSERLSLMTITPT